MPHITNSVSEETSMKTIGQEPLLEEFVQIPDSKGREMISQDKKDIPFRILRNYQSKEVFKRRSFNELLEDYIIKKRKR